MAAELKEEFGVESELDAGGGGEFDVFVNGERVFNKLGEGDRHPNPGEVSERIRAFLKG